MFVRILFVTRQTACIGDCNELLRVAGLTFILKALVRNADGA